MSFLYKKGKAEQYCINFLAKHGIEVIEPSRGRGLICKFPDGEYFTFYPHSEGIVFVAYDANGDVIPRLADKGE